MIQLGAKNGEYAKDFHKIMEGKIVYMFFTMYLLFQIVSKFQKTHNLFRTLLVCI